MKAFKVWIPRWNEMYQKDNFSIELGESAGKVRYDKLLDLWDIFDGMNPPFSFKDIRVVRAPDFDTAEPMHKNTNTVGWMSVDRENLEVEKYGAEIY